MVQLLHDNTAFPGGLDIWRANEPTDLPPIGRWDLRLRDYSANYGYFLRDSRARVTQFGMEVVATFNPLARVTQFGLEVVVAFFPQGKQLSGNAPPGRLRAVDYSFTPPLPLTVLTFLQPVPTGNTDVTSTALPPRPPARSVDYSWFNPLLPNLAGQDALLPDHSTDATALPPRGPARSTSDNYNFTVAFPLTLIGQDAMTAGDQISGNAPAGARRASTLSEPGTNAVIIITAPTPPKPIGQSQAPTELAPRAAPRAVDYTWLRSLPVHLIGQDQLTVGDQLFELPPRTPPRARDYTWLYTLPAQFPPPAPPLPPGVQVTVSEPPRAYPRIRGEYPSLTPPTLPLLGSIVTSNERFQAVLII